MNNKNLLFSISKYERTKTVQRVQDTTENKQKITTKSEES